MLSALPPSDLHVQGRLARKQLPRRAHASFHPKARREDALTLLRRLDKGRIPALLDLKYERMSASPFGFFRGAAGVMAYDLGHLPNTGMLTQLCGDAHILNLGAYAGIDGHLLFDINDFEETVRGPFEWDVKRLATSLVLAGREINLRHSVLEEAVHAFLAAYRAAMRLFAALPVAQLARYQVHRIHAVQPVAGILAKAERATPLASLEKLTEPEADGNDHADARPANRKHATTTSRKKRAKAVHDARTTARSDDAIQPRRFRSQPPVLNPVTGKEAEDVLDSLHPYAEILEPERRHFFSQYRPVDVCFKVVGTGSVGLRDFCVYLQGNGPEDPIFLQIKEEVASVYAPFLPKSAISHTHQGRRVVEGARAMQLQSDPFLGYTRIAGRDFLVRQLKDHKAAFDIKADTARLRSSGLVAYADLCGELLARGHARSGYPVALAAYVGRSDRFDTALAAFAHTYADQTERDWKQLTSSRSL